MNSRRLIAAPAAQDRALAQISIPQGAATGVGIAARYVRFESLADIRTAIAPARLFACHAPNVDVLGQYRKQNLIERYGGDIRLPDLRRAEVEIKILHNAFGRGLHRLRNHLPPPCIPRANRRKPLMSMRDHYRTKAAEFYARARIESNVSTRRQYESLAQQYSKLAEQAERRTAPIYFASDEAPNS